jgi:endothelin-converting enzyme/putative endopeptidase
MNRILIPAVVLLGFTFATVAGGQSTNTLKFDDGAVDPTANPCIDFYQYACGGWLARNPIPADRSRWSIAQQMIARNDARVASLLADLARPAQPRSTNEQKVGDYFASCMDGDTIEASGLKSLQPDLDRISAIGSPEALAEAVARLHRFGSDVLFAFYPDSRLEDASQVIAQIDQSGLSLPEPGFYTESASEMEDARKAYRVHLETVFKLLGESEVSSRTSAADVLAIETSLAKAEMTPVERRDRRSYYHPMIAAGLQKMAPEFPWSRYFAALGFSPQGEINVAVPKYMQALDTLMKATQLTAWKSYLRWQLVRLATPALPARFRAADFKFFREYLDGIKEEPDRSTQCVQLTNRDLGDAVAQEYVRRYFPPETRAKMLTLTDSIRTAMHDDFEQVSWLSPETRKEAIAKLQLLRIMLGYPDHWRDYSQLEIKRGDATGNELRAQEIEFRRLLGKIGKPVDRTEFYELPQGLDGYHDNPLNVVVFTAGILQPPFFDPEMDDAVNFGWAGAVIGHELTHAFDDKGHLFDGLGNLRNWWTPADAQNYTERAACFVRQYSQYPVTKDVNVNGELTLGENIADNGGLRLGYEAFRKTHPDPKTKIAGHTLQQRFFLAWAQWRCMNITDQKARQYARTDEHSPGRWRVNGVVSNMPSFAEAYGCKAGDQMVRAEACRVW